MRLRILSLLALAGVSLVPAACRDQNQGAARVVVIGNEPKLRDPAVGALSAPDGVLLASVGQGLVQFDATGNIVPGLAERWAVTDDGLSYIFRIASTDWSGGRKVNAQQVARILKRSIANSSDNPLKDALGAVDDIVAMTDRVIEIRLRAPRPNLLALLAQPEFAIVRNGAGTGPFQIDPKPEGSGLRLTRKIISADGDTTRRDEVVLSGADAGQAVRTFASGDSDLVLGGTFADLPFAQRARLPRNSLRFDPASGLFGFVPAHSGTPVDNPGIRQLLSEAIDRDALVATFRVPGLNARATVLEPGLDGMPAPTPPIWASVPIAERRATLIGRASRGFGSEKPTIRVLLPQGPGTDILFNRLLIDWGAIGITVERARNASGADLKLIDLVAPSASPAWFVRQFRCAVTPVCDEQADALMASARDTPVAAQRYALLGQAAARIDEVQLFIPLAAPVRWSLVSDRIQGFAGNRFARHTLIDLEQRLSPGTS